jgi:RimJ/RimL family protein N-acetyltransferase
MNQLHFRFATEHDVDLYFEWANDITVRQNSFIQDEISYANHVYWFNSKLQSSACNFFLFLNSTNENVGQIRIDISNNETVIGISIDKNHRGKGYATEMLIQATNHYLSNHPSETIIAYIKKENTASYRSFVNAGFGNEEMVFENNVESYRLQKEKKV